jgi:Zn-finger nucleic acid-binding protein
MLCPVCNVELLLADRQGIEIDYCPKCRGVWLDRGELDKLIERSAMPVTQRDEYRQSPVHHAPPVYHEEHHKPHGHYKHKRKSFLGELFDFD